MVKQQLTGRKFVTTFHGTYNFNGKIKKFYNSVMVRSDLVIAGSNFIFSHIKEKYSNLIDIKKKLLVIFRGVNVDYFDSYFCYHCIRSSIVNLDNLLSISEV